MIALVTGGASSGKSAFAETLALAFPGPHAYVATMKRGGAEAEARIEKHVRARAGKGFDTVELAGEPIEGGGDDGVFACPRPHDGGGSLRSAAAESLTRHHPRLLRLAGTVLVEDLSNLLLNGLEGALPELLSCENAVVVTNEIGCDGVAYDEFTAEFIERLGALSCEVAARADVVVEVVAGVPVVVKGELPWAC